MAEEIRTTRTQICLLIMYILVANKLHQIAQIIISSMHQSGA